MNKMELTFIDAFNAKLNEFSAEVAQSDFSQELTSKLIADLGVKFRDAIEGGFDNPSIEYYVKFIKFMEGLKNDKLGITEVDEAIKAVDDAINVATAEKATKAPTEKATEAATEKAKKAAKNATEKAKKEAGNNTITGVESAAKAVTEAAEAVPEAANTLEALKAKLEALNKALKELKAKLGTTSGWQRKTIKNKTIKNKTKKKKQVKPKTKTKPKRKHT